MDYVELAPSPDLAPWVRCLWALRDVTPSPARGLERVVPDGRMEIVIHLGTPFARLDDAGRAQSQSRAVLAGQLEGPLLLRPGRTVDLFAIRFQPWGAAALLHVQPKELLGRVPPLEDVLGADARHLLDALAEADGLAGRRAAAERWCRDLLRRALAVPRALVAVARDLERDVAGRRVSDLADDVGWGRRRLERAFSDHVGLSPKAFARIARVQRVLAGLRERPEAAWAARALDAGFCDQAHLVREFRELVGTTPARYVAETHGLQDALLEG